MGQGTQHLGSLAGSNAIEKMGAALSKIIQLERVSAGCDYVDLNHVLERVLGEGFKVKYSDEAGLRFKIYDDNKALENPFGTIEA